jgi:hypothetical protein
VENKIPAGWFIDCDQKPIPDRQFDYDFWHEDHDGENGLCGNGASVEDCIAQIKEIELTA